jgi:putative photosynthetic complex assembly protein 2
MIIWHEAAILIGFCALWAAASGGENRLAVYSYGLLWAMRLSSKFNIFLGVPNAPVSFLPERLRHLASCFRERPMNGLFPIVVTIATAGLALLIQRAIGAASEGEAIAYTLLSVFMALAILEHWFLVLPWQSEKLWKWGMRSHHSRLPVEAPLAGVALSSYADARTKGSL